MKERIAVVGAGLVGRAWAVVFARAGHPVALHDVSADALARAPALLERSLGELAAAGLVDEAPAAILGRVTPEPDLAAALRGAAYAQENVLETVEAKRAVFAAMDAAAAPDTVLASSTSGIPASSFTEPLAGRARCLVAHPVNPPSLVPIVEVVPAPWTEAAVVERTRALQASVGQVPILVRRELAGFVINRLQGVLLNEAFHLVEDGIVSSADLDAAMKHGLGLRWSFMGPFETIDLNAPGGLVDYCARYGPLYHQVATESRTTAWGDALLRRVEAERLAELPAERRPERQGWRDRRLMDLVAHKRASDRKHGK